VGEVNKVQKKDDGLKYEVAFELGLGDKVGKYGWKSLTAKETGRIGGLVSKKKKILQLMQNEQIKQQKIG
jgi:small acid-soluble spore protein F (minor alpha/beta-type SASP)